MTLKKYHEKRDFNKTPEPSGKNKVKVSSSKTKPIKKSANLYIIQKHAASHLHYDFRLELNGVLLSWAVPKGPCYDPNVKRLAVHVEDHPLQYGSFEGIIPAGEYGGGTVMLWDKGTWKAESDDAAKAYKKGSLTFILKGKKLKGKWKLLRIHSDPKNWLLMKVADEFSQVLGKYDVTQEEDLSVISKKSMQEIAKDYKHTWDHSGKNLRIKTATTKKTVTTKKVNMPKKKINFGTKKIMPNKIYPQLATLVDKPPEGIEWLHEVKFDGYRLLAFIKNTKIRLCTRSNLDWTDKFPNISKDLNKLKISQAILDGEVVVLNEKHHSDFQLLQNSLKEKESNNFYYYVFDLLYYNGLDLTQTPLIKRKELLKSLLIMDSNILYSDHVVGDGKEIFHQSCKLSLEGIVSKNSNSIYSQKRSPDWLKVKCLKRQEFLIGGFTQPKGSRSNFGSLLIGTFNKKTGKLNYHGHVGTGFNATSLETLGKSLNKIITSTMPFTKKPPKISAVTWVKPNLVAEVAFTEWTTDNILRHPSFKGLRNDKAPQLIQKEIETPVKKILTVTKNTIPSFRLSHPDKLLYLKEKISKQDIADYYHQIHKWILPYICKRPLTLVRCPQGQEKKCFFQKHITNSTPKALRSFQIKDSQGIQNYIYINDEQGLLELVQMSVLEIHPWGSKVPKIEKPDVIIFDLDPAPELPWKKVVAAAIDIKNNLNQLNLKSYLKTTGGKGLHIVVPIQAKHDWDYVKTFTHVFVDFMVNKNPKLYLSNMAKAKRTGKIFLDYLRNQRGATAIAPYSLRAREGATVSVPLHWDELTNHFKDTWFNIHTVQDRLATLKHDPWEEFFKTKQSLNIKNLK